MNEDLLAEVFAVVIVILVVGGVATILVVSSEREEISKNSLCRAIAMDRTNLGVDERVDLYKTCKEKF